MATVTVEQALQIGFAHHLAGRLAEAEAIYRQILAQQPNHADALHLLGMVAHHAGRMDAAAELFRRAIAANPSVPDYHNNLGIALSACGLPQDGIAAYRRALQLKPDFAEAHNNLGNALRDTGRPDEALAAYRRATELKPHYAEALNNLGNVLAEQARFDEANAALLMAVHLRPDFAEAHYNLGNALKDQGRYGEAIAAYHCALQFRPGYAMAHNNLGNAFKDVGQLDDAIASYRRAMDCEPQNPAHHSNLVYTAHFHPGYDRRTMREECGRWEQHYGVPVRKHILPHRNAPDPARRLRVGYVSPDFRDHVIGRNLVPLIMQHDRGAFEIFCYSGVSRSDAMTERFQSLSDHWRGTVGVGDEELAKKIREDGVDILVDLTQHMAGNRLTLFARKPAPVQVSFAGYPESAGLETIECRLSDRFLEPVARDNPQAKSEHVCLLDTFWCYDPCGMDAAVNPVPALEKGRITFGCLNNFCKTNARVMELWAWVLGRVAGSRLILLSAQGSHRERTLGIFASHGVEPHRVEFVEQMPRREYMELYHRLDIMLDTFPYNGHTTSLDALWMGVPVVSLAGETPVSRAGFSQMSNLGRPELIADSEDDYVEKAVALAGDLPRLAQLRSTLRERMAASPLMDAPRFARDIEHAFREMWRAWCAAE